MSARWGLNILIFYLIVDKIKASDVGNKFLEFDIVPDIIDCVPSSMDLLSISYPSGVDVNLGNILTPTQVKDRPNVTWTGDDCDLFTLLMTDTDLPSRQMRMGEFRHWLVINIQGNDLNSGTTAVNFLGSGTPPFSGLHRYTFLLFKQPLGKMNFDLSCFHNNVAMARQSQVTRNFITKYSLEIVAGNFYQCEYDETVPLILKQLAGQCLHK